MIGSLLCDYCVHHFFFFNFVSFPSLQFFIHPQGKEKKKREICPLRDCSLCSGFVGAHQIAVNEQLSVENMNNLLSVRFKEKK